MNELLEFPCAWQVKAFGPGTEAFELEVVSIVRRHAPDLKETAVTTRPSRGGKYLAVSVAICAHSREQLEAIYSELRAHPEVVMTL
jgi:putative lipoic acid-binding regulatory protein